MKKTRRRLLLVLVWRFSHGFLTQLPQHRQGQHSPPSVSFLRREEDQPPSLVLHEIFVERISARLQATSSNQQQQQQQKQRRSSRRRSVASEYEQLRLELLQIERSLDRILERGPRNVTSAAAAVAASAKPFEKRPYQEPNQRLPGLLPLFFAAWRLGGGNQAPPKPPPKPTPQQTKVMLWQDICRDWQDISLLQTQLETKLQQATNSTQYQTVIQTFDQLQSVCKDLTFVEQALQQQDAIDKLAESQTEKSGSKSNKKNAITSSSSSFPLSSRKKGYPRPSMLGQFWFNLARKQPTFEHRESFISRMWNAVAPMQAKVVWSELTTWPNVKYESYLPPSGVPLAKARRQPVVKGAVQGKSAFPPKTSTTTKADLENPEVNWSMISAMKETKSLDFLESVTLETLEADIMKTMSSDESFLEFLDTVAGLSDAEEFEENRENYDDEQEYEEKRDDDDCFNSPASFQNADKVLSSTKPASSTVNEQDTFDTTTLSDSATVRSRASVEPPADLGDQFSFLVNGMMAKKDWEDGPEEEAAVSPKKQISPLSSEVPSVSDEWVPFASDTMKYTADESKPMKDARFYLENQPETQNMQTRAVARPEEENREKKTPTNFIIIDCSITMDMTPTDSAEVADSFLVDQSSQTSFAQSTAESTMDEPPKSNTPRDFSTRLTAGGTEFEEEEEELNFIPWSPDIAPTRGFTATEKISGTIEPLETVDQINEAMFPSVDRTKEYFSTTSAEQAAPWRNEKLQDAKESEPRRNAYAPTDNLALEDSKYIPDDLRSTIFSESNPSSGRQDGSFHLPTSDSYFDPTNSSAAAEWSDGSGWGDTASKLGSFSERRSLTEALASDRLELVQSVAEQRSSRTQPGIGGRPTEDDREDAEAMVILFGNEGSIRGTLVSSKPTIHESEDTDATMNPYDSEGTDKVSIFGYSSLPSEILKFNQACYELRNTNVVSFAAQGRSRWGHLENARALEKVLESVSFDPLEEDKVPIVEKSVEGSLPPFPETGHGVVVSPEPDSRECKVPMGTYHNIAATSTDPVNFSSTNFGDMDETDVSSLRSTTDPFMLGRVSTFAPGTGYGAERTHVAELRTRGSSRGLKPPDGIYPNGASMATELGSGISPSAYGSKEAGSFQLGDLYDLVTDAQNSFSGRNGVESSIRMSPSGWKVPVEPHGWDASLAVESGAAASADSGKSVETSTPARNSPVETYRNGAWTAAEPATGTLPHVDDMKKAEAEPATDPFTWWGISAFIPDGNAVDDRLEAGPAMRTPARLWKVPIGTYEEGATTRPVQAFATSTSCNYLKGAEIEVLPLATQALTSKLARLAMHPSTLRIPDTRNGAVETTETESTYRDVLVGTYRNGRPVTLKELGVETSTYAKAMTETETGMPGHPLKKRHLVSPPFSPSAEKEEGVASRAEAGKSKWGNPENYRAMQEKSVMLSFFRLELGMTYPEPEPVSLTNAEMDGTSSSKEKSDGTIFSKYKLDNTSYDSKTWDSTSYSDNKRDSTRYSADKTDTIYIDNNSGCSRYSDAMSDGLSFSDHEPGSVINKGKRTLNNLWYNLTLNTSSDEFRK